MSLLIAVNTLHGVHRPVTHLGVEGLAGRAALLVPGRFNSLCSPKCRKEFANVTAHLGSKPA
ncbi:MAG: hypothetical protein OXP66_01720, partial [Candidatus Tectomicrobia bacterium]|nr:hypothetical protein [Candidatus Tectomicrobia bacterium]